MTRFSEHANIAAAQAAAATIDAACFARARARRGLTAADSLDRRAGRQLPVAEAVTLRFAEPLDLPEAGSVAVVIVPGYGIEVEPADAPEAVEGRNLSASVRAALQGRGRL